MKFQGALIKEQGVTFAVVIVKENVIHNRVQSDQIVKSFQPIFPGIPVVLMAQNHGGIPSYYGRQDIVRFLANLPIESIPWKEFTVT
jgi:hypothetical protein